MPALLSQNMLKFLPAAAMIPFGTLFNPFSRSHPSSPECAIVIDSGYSYTHVVPLVKGTIVWDAVVRRVFHLFKKYYEILIYVQDRRRREAPYEPTKRCHIIQTVEHDG
jgi:hypothetical protein